MNKGDLVNAVVSVVGKKKTAEEAVNCVLETITGALKKDEAVTLVGFGTFKVFKRAARTGRNPQTGKAIKIKAKKVPKFSAGKKLRDAVAAAKK
jgi:DNA-binding protein HU-beta